MSLYHTTGVLAQCVPYGFQKNQNILCQSDDSIQTSTVNYTIRSNMDYEEILLNAEAVRQTGILPLLKSCPPDDKAFLEELVQGKTANAVWVAESTRLVSEFYGGSYTSSASEAGILCGSFYDDFVYENYTSLPDTPSLQAVRTAYADLLGDFDARTASPSETILKLQDLRDKICDNVSYTLAPGKTPSGTDHAAWFLLENRKGYCEHYATAGTVLARMAGVPARYCEGYMINCSDSGTLTESTAEDGSIAQAPCTSCGLNGGALKAEGEYPAVIACNITNGSMPHITNRIGDADIPYITHCGSGKSAERFITNIKDGTRIIFKYFAFQVPVTLTVRTRAAGNGCFEVKVGDVEQGLIKLPETETWTESCLAINGAGDRALEICYHGDGTAELLTISFQPSNKE